MAHVQNFWEQELHYSGVQEVITSLEVTVCMTFMYLGLEKLITYDIYVSWLGEINYDPTFGHFQTICKCN